MEYSKYKYINKYPDKTQGLAEEIELRTFMITGVFGDTLKKINYHN